MDSQIRMKQLIIVSDGKTTLGNLQVECLPLPANITIIKIARRTRTAELPI